MDVERACLHSEDLRELHSDGELIAHEGRVTHRTGSAIAGLAPQMQPLPVGQPSRNDGATRRIAKARFVGHRVPHRPLARLARDVHRQMPGGRNVAAL